MILPWSTPVTIGSVSFAMLVWGAILTVFLVFVYLIWALWTDRRRSGTDGQ